MIQVCPATDVPSHRQQDIVPDERSMQLVLSLETLELLLLLGPCSQRLKLESDRIAAETDLKYIVHDRPFHDELKEINCICFSNYE